MQTPLPLKIFIVYAREDAEALNELRTQLIPVARSEGLEVWYDGAILPGQHWDQEIKAHLHQADIILLFISKHFFASEYIQATELSAALARHEVGHATIIPIIVRACMWEDAYEVSRFQVLPEGAQPVFSSAWHDPDEAMVSVSKGIKKIARQLRAQRDSAEEQAGQKEAAPHNPGSIPSQPDPESDPPRPLRRLFAYVSGGLLMMLLIWLFIQQCGTRNSNHPLSTAPNRNGSDTPSVRTSNPPVNIEPAPDKRTEGGMMSAKAPSTPADLSASNTPASPPKEPGTSFSFPYAMVALTGGSFTMGNDRSPFKEEWPAHAVHIKPFLMGKYEVTQALWQKVMDNNPAQHSCAECPVERVSWNDVQEFIRKLNEKTGLKYRLPTEAEWEYAARSGVSNGPKYAGSDDVDMVAWFDGNSNGTTHPVGQKDDNAFLLYDMSGNVCEWCQDNWHSSYEGAPKDGSAWIQDMNNTRVFRGGCWHRNYLRCDVDARYWDYSHARFDNTGFRLALSKLPG